jgi:hypothetical protein
MGKKIIIYLEGSKTIPSLFLKRRMTVNKIFRYNNLLCRLALYRLLITTVMWDLLKMEMQFKTSWTKLHRKLSLKTMFCWTIKGSVRIKCLQVRTQVSSIMGLKLIMTLDSRSFSTRRMGREEIRLIKFKVITIKWALSLMMKIFNLSKLCKCIPMIN